MKAADGKSHWLDQPRNQRLLWRGFLLILALTVAAEWLIELHPHFELESWFAFNAWYGFLTCAAMVGVAKLLALWLKRKDRYYHEDGERADD